MADPEITPLVAANELQAAAVQARDAIRAAVDSGGGDLTGSADRLVIAVADINPGPTLEGIPGVAELRGEIERTGGRTGAETKTQIGEAAAEVTGQKEQAFATKEESSFQTVIGHAAFGIPVALLAAYINSLASNHRLEAWRLRHIELQIRTASNPFLGLLDTGRREETLAALALRFFPGQDGVSFDGNGSGVAAPELIELLRALVQKQGSNTGVTPLGAPPVQVADSAS